MDNGSAKLTGIIVFKGDIDTSYAGWTKQKFVLSFNDGYKDQLREFTIGCKPDSEPHRVNNFDKFNKIGMKVDVEFNLRGRQWTNPEGVVKYFNDDEAWKVFKSIEEPSEAQVPRFTDPEEDEIAF